MESKIEKEERLIDGKPIVILAGTCSNPEPPASIKELPLGPLDLAWYMLAEAEIASECDVGIVKSLHSKLKDGPILLMEMTLRYRWITMDVLNSDSAALHAICWIISPAPNMDTDRTKPPARHSVR